jgi:hypothetical protein
MLLRRSLVCREGAVLQSLMEFTFPVTRAVSMGRRNTKLKV